VPGILLSDSVPLGKLEALKSLLMMKEYAILMSSILNECGHHLQKSYRIRNEETP
jgi:hypothetical protein